MTGAAGAMLISGGGPTRKIPIAAAPRRIRRKRVRIPKRNVRLSVAIFVDCSRWKVLLEYVRRIPLLQIVDCTALRFLSGGPQSTTCSRGPSRRTSSCKPAVRYPEQGCPAPPGLRAAAHTCKPRRGRSHGQRLWSLSTPAEGGSCPESGQGYIRVPRPGGYSRAQC